jgi:hypothetical protein
MDNIYSGEEFVEIVGRRIVPSSLFMGGHQMMLSVLFMTVISQTLFLDEISF